MCVFCMLPVYRLFGRWRKLKRRRGWFWFQFIITRYFYDARPYRSKRHPYNSMLCMCLCLCIAAYCKITNIIIPCRLDLDCLVQLWPLLVKAVFNHFWACAELSWAKLQKHLIHLCFQHLSTHPTRSLSLFLVFYKRQSHATVSMSTIFRSLMGICLMLRFLFLENTVGGKNWPLKIEITIFDKVVSQSVDVILCVRGLISCCLFFWAGNLIQV